MRTRIGRCSICGGDVVGETGAWGSVLPPPPARCESCGAWPKGEVIEMVK